MKVIAYSITEDYCGAYPPEPAQYRGVHYFYSGFFLFNGVPFRILGKWQVSDLVLTCPALPPLAPNSESLGVT